jgi:hypothetical protein
VTPPKRGHNLGFYLSAASSWAIARITFAAAIMSLISLSFDMLAPLFRANENRREPFPQALINRVNPTYNYQ